MKSKILLINMFWSLVFSGYGYAGTAIEQEAAITEAMHRQWDQPDQTIEIPTIVIEHDFAIVDWVLGDRGGRALLKYDTEQDQWQTFLCGGPRLTDITELQHAGISLPVARKLLHALHAQEQHLKPDQKALINSFQGVIKFTQEKETGSHAQTHSH